MTPSSYNPMDPSGLALIGHEMQHVQQQASGGAAFYANYGGEYVANRLQGMSPNTAYTSISYEASANRLQDQMYTDFKAWLQ